MANHSDPESCGSKNRRWRDGNTHVGPIRIDFRLQKWEYQNYHFDRNDPVAGWSKSQWQRHIRTLVSIPANVVFTNHALLRMRQRKISRLAAFEILKRVLFAANRKSISGTARLNADWTITLQGGIWRLWQPSIPIIRR